MRQINSNIKSLIENNPVEPILILDIGDSSSILQQRITSSPFDIEVAGNTYEATVDLVGLDLPKNSQIIDKETYRIELSDPDSLYYSYFNIGLTNTPVTLRALFVNTSNSVFLGTNGISYNPEEIITSLGDSIIIYKGLINNAEYITEPDNDTSVIRIYVVSALASLDNKKPARVTKNYLRSINSIDSAFDSVFESKQQITLKWGKA